MQTTIHANKTDKKRVIVMRESFENTYKKHKKTDGELLNAIHTNNHGIVNSKNDTDEREIDTRTNNSQKIHQRKIRISK